MYRARACQGASVTVQRSTWYAPGTSPLTPSHWTTMFDRGSFVFGSMNDACQLPRRRGACSRFSSADRGDWRFGALHAQADVATVRAATATATTHKSFTPQTSNEPMKT